MKKSNKILSCAVSSLIFTQSLSTPMFAMKPKKANNNLETILTFKQQDLNNKIYNFVSKLHDAGVSTLDSNELIADVVEQYRDYLVYEEKAFTWKMFCGIIGCIKLAIEAFPEECEIHADKKTLFLIECILSDIYDAVIEQKQ